MGGALPARRLLDGVLLEAQPVRGPPTDELIGSLKPGSPPSTTRCHCPALNTPPDPGNTEGEMEIHTCSRKAGEGDETAGWRHRLKGPELEWTPGVGDGQGGLACCDSRGRKESAATERLN